MPRQKRKQAAPAESGDAHKTAKLEHGARNPGMELDMEWVRNARVNSAAVLARAGTHEKRRSVKKSFQAGWLLRGMTCIDLTTLAGDDTEERVRRLCGKARQPLRAEITDKLGITDQNLTTGAVCVYPSMVKAAVAALRGTNIPIASVATGFPCGQIPHDLKLQEIERAVQDGATEIDIVISRANVLSSNWTALYNEVRDFRRACGEAHVKTILATGELGTLENVYKASLVCMMAGADFIKTSTGTEKVNATLPVGFVMCRAIREYFERTGHRVGFKPAGGIRTAKATLAWLALIKEELGDEWLNPEMFRIGASALLTDIERQLYHHTNGGVYANASYIPMG